MKLSTLACLAAIGLIGPATLVVAAPSIPPTAQSQATGPRAGQPVVRGGEKRRRTSYAACNRASHQRSLRGGKRRRFLIRCKMGYERPRTPSAVQQSAPPPAPAPPPLERKP